MVAEAVQRYREAMRQFAEMRNLEVWYSRIDVESRFAAMRTTGSIGTCRRARRNLAKARRKDSLRAFSKLTRLEDGEPRLISDPPLIVPLSELLDELGLGDYEDVDERIRHCCAHTAARCGASCAICSRATATSTWRARSWASAAWAHEPGSSSCWS